MAGEYLIKRYGVKLDDDDEEFDLSKRDKKPMIFKAPTLTGGSASSIKKPVLNQPKMADFKKLDYAQSKGLTAAQKPLVTPALKQDLNKSRSLYNDLASGANVKIELPKPGGGGEFDGKGAGRSFGPQAQTPAKAFAYGSERIAQGVLGTAQGFGDYINAQGNRLMSGVTSLGGIAPNKVSETFDLAAQKALERDFTRKYGESIERRYNPYDSQRMVGDFNQMAGAMIPALSAGPTGAQIVIGTSAAGNSAKKAFAEGANVRDALNYGTLSGLSEVATERLAGGIPGLPQGILTSRIGSPFIRKALDVAGEGLEESINTAVDPLLQRITYNPDAQNAALGELGQSALMGSAMSAFMQGTMGAADLVSRRMGEPILPSAKVKNIVDNAPNVVPETRSIENLDAAQKTNQKNRFMQQVNEVMHGSNKGEVLEVGNTPDILKRFGASDRIMTMNPTTVRKIAYPDGYMGGKHNLGFYALEHLSDQLENPVAVLKSATQRDSLVVFTEFLDAQGNPVMVPIHLDKAGRIGISNEVASMYGRGNFNKFIEEQRKLGNILFEDEKRTLQQLPVEGLQLPKMEAASDPIYSISDSSRKSNPNLDISKTNVAPLPEVKKPTLPPNDPMLQSRNWEKPEVDDSVFRLKKTLNEAGGLGGESISAKVPKRQAAQQVTEDTERIAQVLTQDLYRKPSVRESISNSYDFLNRKFVDAGHTIAKVGKITDDPSLYHFYNSAKQSRAQANYAIGGQGVIGSVGAQTDINGNVVGKSLFEIFEPIRKNGDEYHKQFSEYLFHRHNVDRMSIEARAAANPQFAGMLAEIKNKPVFGERVTAEVSLNAAAKLEAIHPEFKQLAEDVYKYNQNLMQYRVDTGLLSQEQAELMNMLYPHYVPTHRYRAATSGAGATNSEVRINTGIKRAKGSNKDLMPIADQMAQQTVQTYAAGRRNLFGNRLLNDAEIHSDKLGGYIHSLSDGKKALDIDEFMDDMNGKFLVYRNGNPVEMEVNTGIFDGVKALAADAGEHNLFMSGAVGANNTFKKLVTGYNPMFIGRNFARDLQDAGLYSKDLAAFAKNYPKAWKEMATNGPLWQKYQALGGFGSSFFDYDKGYKMGTHLNQNRNAAQRFTIDTIENLNMMVEQAPRFAEFMSTVEKGGTSYENLMKAMYDAADVTVNFGRSGTWGKTINRTFVPFFNPSIQGASKMVRRFTETKGAKEWTELVIKAAALGVVPTLLNSLMYQDDKDYQMINQRDKDTNYLFKLDNGLFVKIPKGRVLSLFGMGSDALMRAARGETVDWAGFINTTASQTLPTDPINNHILMQLYNAQLLNPDDPGKTWYGSPIEGMRLQNIQNPAMRYDEKTDRLSRWIGEKTGLSPKKINYVLDSYSGVLGDFALPLLTPQAERNPFMNAFTIDPQLSNNLSERFYNESDRITAARQAQEGNDFNDITSRYLSRQSGLVSDLYDQMRDIQSSTLPDGDKWAQIRPLREQLNALQQQTLDTLPYYEQAAQNAYIGPSDKEIAQAYFDANRELFGAEHALQVYDKDVYAKAKRLNEQGISYDLFADIYNRNKQIRAQYENYEGDDSRATMMATELSKYLDTLNLDPKKRAAVDDAFKFYNMNPADSKAYRFDMLSDAQKEKYAKYKEEKLDGTLWGGIRVSEQDFVKILEITRGYKKEDEKKKALIDAGYSAIEANQIYNQLLK